jgi:hypothetical protein
VSSAEDTVRCFKERTLVQETRSDPLIVALLAIVLAPAPQPASQPQFDALPFAPRRAICHRAPSPMTVDGRLVEDGWRAAAWSEPFIDITGQGQPAQATRMKMLWDDEFWYFAAELDERDLWATLKERDSVIFQDNDFEVFVDPDGDTHDYYELEVNAFATAWDLMLVRPYRDGGPAIHAWDIAGLRVGVDVRGTINRPGDRDEGWTIEIAIPWKILREAVPGRAMPRGGDQWRVNFSRVQWTLDVKDGAYTKRLDAKTGKPLPEDNWVWSPQGAVNMHMPERWGFVQFADGPPGQAVPFVENRNERVKWALRRLYYRQRQYRAANGRYAPDVQTLGVADIHVEGLDFRPVLQTTDSLYEIRANGFDGATVRIRQDGRVWIGKQ